MKLSSPSQHRLPFFHTLALWSIAITQPLLQLLGPGDFFIAHHATPVEILLWLLAVTVVPPVLLGLVTLVHPIAALAINTLLLAALIVQPLHHFLPLPGMLTILIALGVAYWFYRQLQQPTFVRTWAAYAALLVLILPLMFLFTTPVRGLVFTKPDAQTRTATQVKPIPVVFIILDELPVIALLDKPNHIDAARYPNFARLANTSTFYPHTHTVANSTLLAVPAILSGMYPDALRLPTYTGLPQNLFTLFDASHNVIGIESRSQLCPPRICHRDDALGNLMSQLPLLLNDTLYVVLHILLPEDLTGGLPDIANDWLGFERDNAAEETKGMTDKEKAKWAQKQKSRALRNKKDVTKDRMALFDQFLEKIPQKQAAAKPAFYFLHIVLPHSRYNYTPSCVQYSEDTGIVGLKSKLYWGEDERGILQSQQRHQWQLLCADKVLGRLIDHLQKTGNWDQSVVIITADHGVSFRKNDGRRMFTPTNIADIMDVPLFIKQPGQTTGSVNTQSISSIDILPTLAAMLNATPENWEPDGHSFLNAPDRSKNLIFDKSWEKRSYAFNPQTQHQALQLRISRMGTGNNYKRLYQIGPRADWIGKPVSQFPQGKAIENLKAIPLQNNYGSFLFRAQLRSPQKLSPTTPPDIAIAVNGVIWSTYPYFYAVPGLSDLGLTALLPEEVVKEAPNPAIRLYLVENGTLRAIPTLEEH